jgi:arsenate reductase (glutaredoxin)
MHSKIYHNPRCRKSRETLELLHSKGIQPDIILYLENPPSKSELESIITALGISSAQLIRRKEKKFDQYKKLELDDAKAIELMTKMPKLIERPILLHDGKAAIGRPPEAVLSLF